MSGAFYKGLGFLVWKGGKQYVRHRYRRAAPRRGGVRGGVLALAALTAAGAELRAQRRGARAH